jgi:hypothetical protein
MAAQRVLHVISSTMRAGVTIMVMNMYRAVDREKVQFDFIAHDLGDDDFGPEIEALGGRVFRLPFLSRAAMSVWCGIYSKKTAPMPPCTRTPNTRRASSRSQLIRRACPSASATRTRTRGMYTRRCSF